MLPNFSELFDRPVVILAAPRSGSTLLFETLAEVKDIWTIGGESHQIIESIRALNPGFGQVDSNRLTKEHADAKIISFLQSRFARYLRDRDGREFFHNRHIPKLRFLEKTPKNALRQPFMEEIFPGALYVYLFRDVRANLSSMMEAWRSRRWVTYPNLRGWKGPPWSLLLPPEWQSVNGRPLEEICAFQWANANRIILEDLQHLPSDRWMALNYQSLIDEPEKIIGEICKFADLEMDVHLSQRLQKPLPLSRLTHTQPDVEKWRKNEQEISAVLDSVAETEASMAPLGYCRTN